jgi:hypothetical protein
MKVQRLVIDQQRAQIEITNQMGRLAIDCNYRRGMQVDAQHASMTADYQPGKVMLDATALQDNLALRNFRSLQRHSASVAQQKAQAGTRETSQDGEFTAQQPHAGSSLVGQLARQKTIADHATAPTYGRSTVPEAAVKMTGVAGGYEVEWEPQQFEINWDQLKGPNITLEPPPSVDIRLAQDAQVECQVVEESIPAEPGVLLDING